MKKTTKRRRADERKTKRDRKRRLKGARYAARLTPAQLAAVLCDRTRHSPERLLKLASQLSQLADVRLELRTQRRELRESRRRGAGATVAPASAPASAAPATTDLPQPADAEIRCYAHIVASLHLAGWPTEWTDLLHASHTPPARVAEALLLAMRRVQ
jgi:hypothetical protein